MSELNRAPEETPCRCAAVPLKADKFDILDEFTDRLRIYPPLGGAEGQKRGMQKALTAKLCSTDS